LDSGLETVTFEAGSRLREIEPGAFSGCQSVKQLFLPASLEKMSGASLPLPRSCRIEIESGNPHFGKIDDFVIDLKEHCVLRYCGSERDVRIPEGIEKVDERCFVSFESIRGVKRAPMAFDRREYRDCATIRTVTIPSSVANLGGCCFRHCFRLQSVSFCAGSQLNSISAEAFSWCSALASIVLPASVKTLGAYCFCCCCKLVSSPLPADSELVRIEPWAFVGCSLLNSMVLPSSVEFVGDHCFEKCDLLLGLTFASPSHVRELLLDFSLRRSCAVSIPDSVEILSLGTSLEILSSRSAERTLSFGRESRLTEFRDETYKRGNSLPRRLFLQFASSTLKTFRIKLEFDEGR
jgi:hypothetical protein